MIARVSMLMSHRWRTWREKRVDELQEIARENERQRRRRTRQNADDNQSSVIIDRRAGDDGKSFFSFSLSFLSLFIRTTIIEILLSRSAQASSGAQAKYQLFVFFLSLPRSFSFSFFVRFDVPVFFALLLYSRVSSACVSSPSSSSCLIYSRMQMMPSRDDYQRSFSQSSSLDGSWKEKLNEKLLRVVPSHFFFSLLIIWQ